MRVPKVESRKRKETITELILIINSDCTATTTNVTIIYASDITTASTTATTVTIAAVIFVPFITFVVLVVAVDINLSLMILIFVLPL